MEEFIDAQFNITHTNLVNLIGETSIQTLESL